MPALANRIRTSLRGMPVEFGRYRNFAEMGMDMLKRYLARKALERTMRPDPIYRERMLAQFSKERRERYWANVRAALHPAGD